MKFQKKVYKLIRLVKNKLQIRNYDAILMLFESLN